MRLQLMFVSLDSIRFPIPFKQITLGEQQLIERINSCRKSGRQLIGEAKMSDRQTTIILSYLITLLITNNPQQSHHQEAGKDDQQMKTVVYLCRGQTRKNQLLNIAEHVYKFVLAALEKQEQKIFSLQKQQSQVFLKFYLGLADQDKSNEDLYQHCKAKGLAFKRICFMRFNQFLQLKLRRKQQSVWKKAFQFGCQTDYDVLQLNYLNKKVDYLLIETNDLEGLMTDLLTVELCQIHLHRAFIQFRKLNKFYNHRVEQKKIKNPSRQGSKKDFEIKPAVSIMKQSQKPQEADDGLQSAQVVMKKLQHDQDQAQGKSQEPVNHMQVQVFTPPFRKRQDWNVAEYDKKFNQLYKQKKELLMTTKVGYVPNTSVSPEYEQCYYLMNLQIIGYILSFLIIQWKQNQFQQSHDHLNSFLNYVYSKTLIPTSYMRKLKRIFLSFVTKHPPLVKDQLMSYKYIKQILYFFEKAVIWNEVFCKPYLTSTQPNTDNGNQINLGNRFVVLRQKKNKDSNLKIICLDQKILIDILSQSSKNFSILQNSALSFEYYENIFRPQKLKDIQLEYRCPKLVGQFYKHTINGFIVSSTPNEQDLHLSNDRQQVSSGDELLQDKKEDKDHYSQIIRAYGVLVHDICELIPDGVIVFFPTRNLLRECRAEWQSKENIYQKINEIKHIYQQQQWERDNLYNIYSFKKKCQIGRGAVYFLSADSQLAKYQTFFSYYSKCIIFLGVPYNPFPLETDQKLKFLRLKEHYHFEQALKNVCRCLSNCINSTAQIKTVVFADIAYNRTDLQKKWFPFIKEGNLNTLQVLDLILNVNKSASNLIKKQREEEQKRKRQEIQRKKEDNLDRMRRINSQMMNQY